MNLSPIRPGFAMLLVAMSLTAAGPAGAAEYPAGFEERTLATGLPGPIAIDWAPDGRLFVAEKDGRVDVVAPGSTTATTILDLSDRINHAGDRGMLGLAVDTDYASNNYLYLLYTVELQPMMQEGVGPMVSQLLRVKVRPDNTIGEQKVLLGSYTAGPCPQAANTLDCIPSDGLSHGIGTVRSAPDGTLWVGSGDAADFGGVDQKALRTYDERSFAGKILHIDREGRGLASHSFCATEADLRKVCTKIHSKGFRNPYRFSLRANGDLVVADVGWNRFEEIDVIRTGGRSYGWPCYEAAERTPGYSDLPQCEAEYAKEGTPAAHLGPQLSYSHEMGAAVLAGPEYDGDQYPAGYRGSVFYGDYVGGFIRRLRIDAGGNVTGSEAFAADWAGGVSLEETPEGNLAYPEVGTFENNGTVREVVYTSGNRAPRAVLTVAGPTAGPAPLTVDFDASGSNDPDGDALSYDWDFGDGSPHSSDVRPQHVYTQGGARQVRLTVSDGRGRSDTKTLTVYPGESAPTPTIDAPLDRSLFSAGEDLQLRGSATDVQDGRLPPAALRWRVALHHASHVHPTADQNGVEQTTVRMLSDHDADSWYEISLTATDSKGLSATRTVRVDPRLVDLSLESVPAGAPLSYAGLIAPAPYTRSTATGFKTTASAAASFVSEDRPFYFDRWADGGDGVLPDGGERVLAVSVPQTDFTLRARYVEDKASGQPASASASLPAQGPELAVDGDQATVWSSPAADGQSWQVDLGRTRAVDRVELLWSEDLAPTYRLATSVDGINFTPVATETANAAGPRLTRFDPGAARWLRVEATSRQEGRPVALREARVLGPVDPPPVEPEPEPEPEDPSPEVTQPPGRSPSPKENPDRRGRLQDGPYTRAVAAVRSIIAHFGLGDRGRAGGRAPGRRRDGSWTRGIVAGSDGGARRLDGRDDLVVLPMARLGVPRRPSVEAWVRSADRNGTVVSWSSGRGREMALSLARGRPRLEVTWGRRRGVATGARLRRGRPHHLVASFDGRALRLWVDGRPLRVRLGRAPRTRSTPAHAWLGARPDARRRARDHYRGVIDEVAFYRAPLRRATIARHRRLAAGR